MPSLTTTFKMAKILKHFGIGSSKKCIINPTPSKKDHETTSENKKYIHSSFPLDSKSKSDARCTKISRPPSTTTTTTPTPTPHCTKFSEEFPHYPHLLLSNNNKMAQVASEIDLLDAENKLETNIDFEKGQVATSGIITRDSQESLQWGNSCDLLGCKIDDGNKVVVFEEYSNPIDFQTCELDNYSNDYAEPCVSEECECGFGINKEYDEDDIYEEIADLDEDYDNPWEWMPCGKLNLSLHNNKPEEFAGRVEENESIMTSRQRRCYETAFDSTVKHEKCEFEEITNHPVLRSDSVTPKTTPKLPIRAVTSHEVPRQGYFTPNEKRKVTLFRDGRRICNQSDQVTLLSYNKVRDSSPGFRTEQVKAVVHPPPKSANSTPLLSHRLRRIDSIASSARSTPTHYMSTAKVKVPNKPLSDLTLTCKSSSQKNSPSFHVVPPSAVSKLKCSYSSEGRFSFQSSDGETHISTSDSVISDSSLKTDSSETLSTVAKNSIEQDVDLPWKCTQKKRNLPFSFSMDSAQLLQASVNSIRSTQEEDKEIEKKPPSKPSLNLALNKQDSLPADPTADRGNLNLNFGSQCQKRKQMLQLNFGCAALSVVGEKIDPTIPVERQGWYHGSISRVDAENVLRLLKEGSYLVRNSESNRNDYSLSLKSARGFMHMKIVNTDEKFILGQFSKPFNNIPEMINHYSINKLPIKGAEHMSLLYPVMDQLL